MNYYISDMHFFHKNVTKEGNNFDNRPFNSLAEMHQYMKEKWNSKITNGDTVYILGDIAMRGTNEELIALVAQLKGRKVLIKGNHDDVSDMRYKNIFEEIYDYKEITDYVDQDAYKLDGLKDYEIGYLPQQTVVQKDFPATVWEVVLSGTLAGSGFKPFYGKKEKSLAIEKMRELDITDLKKKCYRNLSGGQQQRVLLA